MDYSEAFLEMLHFLRLTYTKFMIEVMAENYGIPRKEVKPLIHKFRKEGILLILKNEGCTFTLHKDS